MNQVLLEKWDALLSSDKAEAITDDYKKKVTAQLLENQEKFLAEAATSLAGDVANWDPVLISLVRRMAPKLIAYDLCGVQPMTMPTGLVFAMRSKYVTGGAEAFVDEADTDYSGAGAHAGSNPFSGAAYTTGTGQVLATAEADNAWKAMNMTIEKTSVEAKTRQLRADYSLELAQDLKAVHGLDAENELSNILSTEITSEINREIVRNIYSTAKVGAQFTTAPGTFDLSSDSDGRWSVERYKGLMYAIERDANAIATQTRRGKGNYLVCTADVASSLVMAGLLDYTPNIQSNTSLEVDVTGVAFAGTMGRYKVFVDPYVTGDGYVVGYKGTNQYDAGMFYCPYVPLQLVKATNVDTFQPAIGFKTRYGIVANPFTTLAANSNVYYRKVQVTNLL